VAAGVSAKAIAKRFGAKAGRFATRVAPPLIVGGAVVTGALVATKEREKIQEVHGDLEASAEILTRIPVASFNDALFEGFRGLVRAPKLPFQ